MLTTRAFFDSDNPEAVTNRKYYKLRLLDKDISRLAKENPELQRAIIDLGLLLQRSAALGSHK